MRDFLAALGLVFVIEGAIYALFPRGMQQAMAQMQTLPPQALRIAGIVGMALGWLIVYLAREG